MGDLVPLPHDASTGSLVWVRLDNGDLWLTHTRSRPWMAGSEWIVLLEGRTGGYSLRRCYVLPEWAVEAAMEYDEGDDD